MDIYFMKTKVNPLVIYNITFDLMKHSSKHLVPWNPTFEQQSINRLVNSYSKGDSSLKPRDQEKLERQNISKARLSTSLLMVLVCWSTLISREWPPSSIIRPTISETNVNSLARLCKFIMNSGSCVCPNYLGLVIWILSLYPTLCKAILLEI